MVPVPDTSLIRRNVLGVLTGTTRLFQLKLIAEGELAIALKLEGAAGAAGRAKVVALSTEVKPEFPYWLIACIL